MESSIVHRAMTALLLLVSLLTLSLTVAVCPANCRCDMNGHRVECRGAGLTVIRWDLDGSPGLTYLDLSGNRIHDIRSQIVSYPNLEHLDLSNNSLKSISDSAFGKLESLQYLNLSRNRLQLLTERTFHNLNSLRRLDLSYNEIMTLDNRIFVGLTKLETLDLSGNVLESVAIDAFLGLPSLSYLSLHGNRLDVVPNLRGAKNLSTFWLSDNLISTLRPAEFAQLTQLQILNLNSNRLSVIPDYLFSESSHFEAPLQTLSLSDNLLHTVPSDCFRHLKRLREVDLSRNRIERVSSNAFRDLSNLQSVFINSCPRLHTVEAYAFTSLPKLSTLELYANHRLSLIDCNAFSEVPRLEYVDLHSNDLRSLCSSLLSSHTLRYLNLQDDAWICDCKLSWLRTYLRDTHSNRTLHRVYCAGPHSLAGRKLVDLSAGDLTCPDVPATDSPSFQRSVMIGMFVGFISILFLVLLCLACRYKGSFFHGTQNQMNYIVYRNPVRLCGPPTQVRRKLRRKPPVFDEYRVAIAATEEKNLPGGEAAVRSPSITRQDSEGNRSIKKVRFAD